EQSQYLQLLSQYATLPNNHNETNKQSSLYQLLTVNGIKPDLNKKVYVPLIPEWLRGYVNNTYSNLFEHAKKLFTAEKKCITIINSAKCKARKLEDSEDIQARLPIKAEG
ncbi:2084_t:CDS:2, partial [Racocetra fulgida]